jgi:hypothetical protein
MTSGRKSVSTGYSGGFDSMNHDIPTLKLNE